MRSCKPPAPKSNSLSVRMSLIEKIGKIKNAVAAGVVGVAGLGMSGCSSQDVANMENFLFNQSGVPERTMAQGFYQGGSNAAQRGDADRAQSWNTLGALTEGAADRHVHYGDTQRAVGQQGQQLGGVFFVNEAPDSRYQDIVFTAEEFLGDLNGNGHFGLEEYRNIKRVFRPGENIIVGYITRTGGGNSRIVITDEMGRVVRERDFPLTQFGGFSSAYYVPFGEGELNPLWKGKMDVTVKQIIEGREVGVIARNSFEIK